MVVLTYHPTAAGNGNLTLNYTYLNSAGTSKTGTATYSYAATAEDNVVATPSPAGQIAVITGGTSAVGITFTTDDGRTATNLSITGLGSLPAGWTGPATFACAAVSTGNGCLLNLSFAPMVVGSGTLTLSFAYTDNAGTAKTGSVSIPYIATSQNHVIATQTPAGQIVAVLGHSQTVTVNFTTDDANPATALTITPANLTSLPAGWTGPATFTCATVSTGNGCQLSFTYAPTQIGTGTINLNFGYTNDAGVAATGSFNIAYAATADNTVIGTPSPSGTINAVVGQGTQTVTVTFNSNDGNPAANLVVTGGLATLPAGWSGPGAFTCAAVNTGNTCQLALTYSPTAVTSGTLQLTYGYNANSGTAKTGSVSIAYTATTNNNLVATQSPAGTISAMVNSGSVPVTLTFTTDDGNPATAISITGGLGTLPSGWSGPATFACPTASTGTGCQVVLTYAPTVNASGTVALTVGYTDDAGMAKTLTVNIAYNSIAGYLWVTDQASHVLSCAIDGGDGTLSACVNAASGLHAPTGIAFNGNFAYVTPGIAGTDVDVCPVNANGTLGACTSALTLTAPNALTVSGGYLYVTDASSQSVEICTLDPDGTLSNCNANYFAVPMDTMDGITVTGTTGYITDYTGDHLTTCTVNGDGSLFPCSQQALVGTTPAGGNTPNAFPRAVSAYGGNLYVGTNAGTLILPINGSGAVAVGYPCSLVVGTSCTDDLFPAQSPATGFAFDNGYAYVAGFGSGGGVGKCTIEASGILDQCVTSPSLPAGIFYGGLATH